MWCVASFVITRCAPPLAGGSLASGASCSTRKGSIQSSHNFLSPAARSGVHPPCCGSSFAAFSASCLELGRWYGAADVQYVAQNGAVEELSAMQRYHLRWRNQTNAVGHRSICSVLLYFDATSCAVDVRPPRPATFADLRSPVTK
eukprot:gene1271-biopygen4597